MPVSGRGLILLSVMSVTSTASMAFEPVPAEAGFSGFINLGMAYIESKSNMVAGNDWADLGQRKITSINDSPDSKSDVTPLLNFEISYTFAPSRTQIVFGNRLEDFVRFDTTTQLGVRRELADSSIIGASVVFSSIPTEVWSDPYVVGQKRSETDRESRGMRLEYSHILGSKFGAELTWRDIEIDDESSGRTQLALPKSQARLLDREGDEFSLEVKYLFTLEQGRQVLIPSLRYSDYDLDGDAMAFDAFQLQLTHLYQGQRWNIATNLLYARQDHDGQNPIYGKTREDDVFGGGVQVFYKRAFDVEGLSLVGTLAYYQDDSNIGFYDTTIGLAGVSALYRF